MGTLFYLVSDEKKEAFELGKGQWALAVDYFAFSPHQLGDVKAFVKRGMSNGTSEEYIERVAGKIVDFVRGHPDCRVCNDARDELWIAENDEDFPDNYNEERDPTVCYRQIGTRYESK